MDEAKVSVRVELEGQILEDFNSIKQSRHFEINTEAIRYCITETANTANFRLVNEQIQIIKSLIQNSYVRSKYHIFDVNDFIKKAIDQYIDEIRSSTESIQSFDVRMTLTPEENEIALGALELQSMKSSDMFTATELTKFLGFRDSSKIKAVLDGFVENHHLSKQNVKGEIYYHARK